MATSVLRRIVRPAVVPEPDSVLAARALRIAMTRAAQNHAALPLSVLGIGEQVAMLDAVLQGIGADLMLVGIGPQGASGAGASGAGAGRAGQDGTGHSRAGLHPAEPVRPAGFVAIDPQTRAALIEAQMLGRVLSVTADPRPPTHADMAMAEPLVTCFLAELAVTTEGTPLAGWAAGQQMQGRIADAREAGLRLADGRYRVVRLTLDLGAGGRQGLVMIALPLPEVAPPPDVVRESPGWAPRLAANVLAARSEVTAVLHRMSLPLTRVEGFAVDDLLLLDGVSVASVRIEALDGRLLGTGRLGQMGGMRAVRVEPPPAHRMADTPLMPPRPRDATTRALPLPPEADGAMRPAAAEPPPPLVERRRPDRPFTPPPQPAKAQSAKAQPAPSPQEAARNRADERAGAPAADQRMTPDSQQVDMPEQPVAAPPVSTSRTLPVEKVGVAATPSTIPRGGAALDPGDTPDLRPVEDLPSPATISPIRADMPTGIAISDDVVSRGGLDLADEVDLDPQG